MLNSQQVIIMEACCKREETSTTGLYRAFFRVQTEVGRAEWAAIRGA